MASKGFVVTTKFSDNCWGCGDRIEVGDEILQGYDDHNYCLDYCADLTETQIAANAREWADFNGATI